MRVDATCKMESWNEHPWAAVDGAPALNRADVRNRYSGGLEGTGTLTYLMAARPDGTADFVGYERIEGRIGERAGSFVLRHDGTYANGRATYTCTVVPGTASGDLAGLTGRCELSLGHTHEYPVAFDFAFDEPV